MQVQSGDGQGIAGFIITPGNSKQVMIRGLGPSLAHQGVVGVIADPVLELHDSHGANLVTNDNWHDTQAEQIIASQLAPTNDREPAIIATLAPGAYTVILRGAGATTGVALVEIYDLDPSGTSRLGNLSTRAAVGSGNEAVIAGFILGVEQAEADVVIRGLGPSLARFGLPGITNPTVELRDSDGNLLISDDNWQDNAAQAALLTASGLAPRNAQEAALEVSLPPGTYTAILASDGETGLGLIEIYNKQ